MLKNATALITGGAQGLGRGFAKCILELGGKVSLVDIKTDVGLDTQNEFNAEFGQASALFIKCDVRNKQDFESAFRKTRDTFGSLDIVINNAGVASDDNWERTIDINLTAVLRGCLLASEYLRNHNGERGGQIINIASTAGLTPVPFDPAYVGSKTGVVGISRSLALQFQHQAITVKCLCPSFAQTDILQMNLPSVAEMKNVEKYIQLVGVMEVSAVVAAFRELLLNKEGNGAVLSVTPKGFDYKYRGRPVSSRL